jgi:hypothetical protein
VGLILFELMDELWSNPSSLSDLWFGFHSVFNSPFLVCPVLISCDLSAHYFGQASEFCPLCRNHSLFVLLI